MSSLLERIALEDALYEFSYTTSLDYSEEYSLASCSLKFFEVLNYPIEYINEECLNMSVNLFLQDDLVYIQNKSIGKYLEFIDSISELFSIGENIFEADQYLSDNFEIRGITYLAVELKKMPIDHYCTRNITNIISSVYGRPVFILFRYYGNICFGLPFKRKNKLNEEFDVTQNQYSTPWIDCNYISNDSIDICNKLRFENLELANPGDFYFSLFYSLGYYIDTEGLTIERADFKFRKVKTYLNYAYETIQSDYNNGRYSYDQDALKWYFIRAYIIPNKKAQFISNELYSSENYYDLHNDHLVDSEEIEEIEE